MRNFHITIDGKRYAVSAERDAEPSKLKIVLEGETHIVEIEEEPSSASGERRPTGPPPRQAARSSAGGEGKILAPLPGVVLSVDVAEGESVEAGDRLLVLEAMKMENVIAAEKAGTVESIHVRKGDKVETDQLLVEIA